MRIKETTEEHILFDNGDKIEFSHFQCCCECNYADFNQLEKIAFHADFETPLEFEKVEDSGFRFGNKGKMFYVPCYSEQNGYYSSDVDIYFNGDQVLNVDAKLVEY